MVKNLPIFLLGLLTAFLFGIMLTHGQEISSSPDVIQESSSQPFVLPKEIKTVEQQQEEIDHLKLLVSQYAEKYYSCSNSVTLVTVPLSWISFGRNK